MLNPSISVVLNNHHLIAHFTLDILLMYVLDELLRIAEIQYLHHDTDEITNQ